LIEERQPLPRCEVTAVAPRNGSFAVKVSIPGSHPTMVTGFSTEPAATAWMANHTREVAEGNSLRRRLKKI
jgi:hypothetical protein